MDAAPQSPRPRRLGVVTGLASETAVLTAMLADAALEVEVVCAGSSSKRAAQLAERLASQGVEAVLSFGIAGALAPDLEGGELIVAHGVRDAAGTDFSTDGDWRQGLTAALQEAEVVYREGAILGSAHPLRSSSEKAAAFAESGCLAVDLESAAVAAVAADLGLPFLAVRAVADCASESLPAFVATAVKLDGRPDLGRVLRGLVRRPSDIIGTIRAARQTELALARLRMLEMSKAALLGCF